MIVPALLTDKKNKLIQMLEVCSGFCDFVQIDIMDGIFVPSKSLSLDDLKGLNIPVRSEAHLMVADPLEWLAAFKALGAEKLIYHFEIKKDHSALISEIKKNGLKAGLAVNPDTAIKDFEYLLDEVDTVLFMSVNPGFYGAQFIPGVLEKIKKFKTKYPDCLTGIDGGVKLSNARLIKSSGVDYICVGSAVLQSPDPQASYQELVKITNG
ncbi:MAG: ribulose-phosphate 3-epimerase [Candidatus Omnitrophica bacterium]|nr:ribulose-phosphate 3-epimerase [Candidatus Omnitrophota bacterium]MBU2043942.1 ribulose-phosphate 3-epimerase [Candidatus Omnitrophota bacterium]MBU2251224.1 ribulose-phosphate 3-epimerase [Candidatus Omnitrophota bacterium]MBU2474147.1 ribulose-phosphate 3-epimerase [Candidatus Omnitrophota bacterium]